MGKVEINLKTLLEERGISARELARMTGIHREGVRILITNEAKQYSAQNLARICDVLNVDIADILVYKRKQAKEGAPQ